MVNNGNVNGMEYEYEYERYWARPEWCSYSVRSTYIALMNNCRFSIHWTTGNTCISRWHRIHCNTPKSIAIARNTLEVSRSYMNICCAQINTRAVYPLREMLDPNLIISTVETAQSIQLFRSINRKALEQYWNRHNQIIFFAWLSQLSYVCKSASEVSQIR